MDINEKKKGENEFTEFKKSVPEKSIKYMKTVVAFANGRGGKIIFGVENNTCEIIGVPQKDIFTIIDSITNAISDSCEPKIIPSISLKNINDKTIIIVEILKGMQSPYYIKSEGIQNGTYQRIGATTRNVEAYTLKELILEGSGRSFDSIPINSQKLTEKEIDETCKLITSYTRKRAENDIEKKSIKKLSKNQLISWGIIVEKNNKYIPTYAYNLLSGQPLPSGFSEIQCGVFKGKSRAVFLDRKTYSGPIYEQIDEAYNFVLRNIRMGARVKGSFRHDVYELPPSTIRELICNAVCHRSYLQPSNIQVAVYDDRLEITSPGMLSKELTIEKIMAGYSKIRNRGIANVFSYMHIIEAWGSGIPRMIEECDEYGIRPPEFIDFEGDFRICLYRNINTNGTNPVTNGTNPVTNGTNPVTNGTNLESNEILYKKILGSLKTNPKITQQEISKLLNISLRTVKRILARLQEENIVKRKGSSRAGTWLVVDEIR
ncbi:ATP-binding protein [Treponema denticola]|uniref:ATP-binding protein n=1 Tax=Treponema denticola TaxID=158 RepID=UPI002106748C|nr:ATP-binding protein [Treponema denticola]UTY26903.1 winged helix-turn-helix transcriptional regulator [Treponema denticola]